ncbi:hypothetical protein [Streptomyces sp. HD]|uniref:hypothetical protein n=1 Tax=Streptomyces sp. HD TaxID=3020892 RepID=UPI00232E93A9|nr:hypothetical protein [Streptomyces sp. HD]MDC0765787.1 hypothetical protein [Streptomyces sp. HD]
MGLRITVDIFSGRTNPTWEIQDADQARELIRLISRNRSGVAEISSGFTGLGFRGIQVEITDDLDTAGLPPRFELAGGGAQDPFASAEVAEQLLATMPVGEGDEGSAAEADTAGGEETGWPQEFREGVRQEIQHTTREGAGGATTIEPTESGNLSEAGALEVEKLLQTLVHPAALTCSYDVTPFNPAFWNRPDTQPYNNCYNFAVNRRTNTFAQPGRAHGYTIPGTVRCSEVSTGALRDGLRTWGNCQPAGSLRYVVALVTGTILGRRDYHWYRLHPGGIWCHKPGGGTARDWDNSNKRITNPYTCDRGGYTEWCGLFQTHQSIVIR